MGCKKAYKWSTIGNGRRGIEANFDTALEKIAIHTSMEVGALDIGGFCEFCGDEHCTVTKFPKFNSEDRHEVEPPLLGTITVAVIPED